VVSGQGVFGDPPKIDLWLFSSDSKQAKQIWSAVVMAPLVHFSELGVVPSSINPG
jgi:hypothetical protein